MIAPQPIPFSPDRTVQQIGLDVTNIKDALGTPPAGKTIAAQGTHIADQLDSFAKEVTDELDALDPTVKGIADTVGKTEAAIGSPVGGLSIAHQLDSSGTGFAGLVADKFREVNAKLDFLIKIHNHQILFALTRRHLASSDSDEETKAILDHLKKTYQMDVNRICNEDPRRLRSDLQKIYSGQKLKHKVADQNKYQEFVRELKDNTEW